MQNIKKTLKSKRFWLGTVLPFALAVAAAFVARYQLEISDGVTANYMAGQWPVYAPLNALTAFCLTLVVFALCGSWGIATGVSGLIFTVLALVNYYTRDLHGSALMPQDILNLGTAAEVMGSYTLHITQTVITIALLYIPVLVAAVVQVKLAGKHKRSWKQRGAHALACACGIFAVLYLGYFSPNPIKPATTYGWAWQETYYKYGYLAGSLEAASLMVDPILQPDGYSEDAATEAAAMAQDYQASPETANEQDYPDVFLILSESFYDFDLVTDLQADQEIMQVTKNLPNSIYGHTISPHVGGGTNSSEYEMLSSNSLMLMPSITPFNWLNLHKANSLVSNLKDLGYATLAAHTYTNSNYRRDSAWLTLGFDETHFQDDFPTKETYGSRPYQTDSATFNQVVQVNLNGAMACTLAVLPGMRTRREGTVKNLTAEAIADITSSGETLRANHLKILSDGLIHSSQATLFASRMADWAGLAASRAALMACGSRSLPWKQGRKIAKPRCARCRASAHSVCHEATSNPSQRVGGRPP